MKFLLSTGKKLDLNFQFGTGGNVDNVKYEVPAHLQDIITIDASGVITPLKVGTAIVNVLKPDNKALIESVTIEVLSPADYTLQSGLAAGTTSLSASASLSGSSTPSYTLVTPMNAVGDGYSSASAIDGLPETWYESATMWSNIIYNYVGVQFNSPKQVRKLSIKLSTPPRYIYVKVSSDGSNWTTVQTIEPSANIQYDAPQNANALVWQEFTLQNYTATNFISLWPVSSEAVPGTWWALNNPGGQIDRFRVHEMKFYI